MHALWKGSYPAIFDRNLPPPDWLGSYTATCVERDVRHILNISDLVAFQGCRIGPGQKPLPE